jgi:hypothetical protein
MRTMPRKTHQMLLRLCLGFVFVLGSVSLCQAQGHVGGDGQPGPELSAFTPVPTSAPALDGWEWSPGVGDLKVSVTSVEDVAMAYVPPAIAPPLRPPSGEDFVPAVSPEPATTGLLLAGAAALWRWGRGRRSA